MNRRTRMEIAVYPLGTGNPDVSEHVSRILGILDRCDLPFEVTTMGTIIEGPIDELFSLALRLHDSVLSDSVQRVVTVMKIDDIRGDA